MTNTVWEGFSRFHVSFVTKRLLYVEFRVFRKKSKRKLEMQDGKKGLLLVFGFGSRQRMPCCDRVFGSMSRHGSLCHNTVHRLQRIPGSQQGFSSPTTEPGVHDRRASARLECAYDKVPRAIGAFSCDRDFSVATELSHGMRPCARDKPWPRTTGACARPRSLGRDKVWPGGKVLCRDRKILCHDIVGHAGKILYCDNIFGSRQSCPG